MHCGAETVCEGGSNEELAARGACSRQAIRLRPSPAGGGLRASPAPGPGLKEGRGRLAERPGRAERGGRGASPDAPARAAPLACARSRRAARAAAAGTAGCFLRGAGRRPRRVARRTRPGFLVALHGGGSAQSIVYSAPQTAVLWRLGPCPSPECPGRGVRFACRSQTRGPGGPCRNPSCEPRGRDLERSPSWCRPRTSELSCFLSLMRSTRDR